MITARGRGGVVVYSAIVGEPIIGPDNSLIWVPKLINHSVVLPSFSSIGSWKIGHLCTDQPTPENPQIAVNPRVIFTAPGVRVSHPKNATRSATVGMPNGRVPPFAFGISTRRTGGGM